MAELAAKIILGGSLFGIGTILFRKMPLLVEIPVSNGKRLGWKGILLKLWGLVKFLKRLVLRLILPKIKVVGSAVEKKADIKLQGLREEAKARKNRKNDNYWEELKKAKDENNEDLPA